jgi:hypothetical protein
MSYHNGFQIYRPEKPTNRLEGKYHKNLDVWAPSVHYKKSLQEIREQRTPAEEYKYQLQTAGKLQRTLQRLEWRWEKDLERWRFASTRIKSLWRGMKSRIAFAETKKKLERERDQREIRLNTLRAFAQNNIEGVLGHIDAYALKHEILDHPFLILMKVKIFYGQERYAECEKLSRMLVDLTGNGQPREEDETCADAMYALSNCLARRGELEAAYDVLKDLVNSYGPRTDACRLQAFLAVKLLPPK